MTILAMGLIFDGINGLIPCSSIKSISNICSLQQRLYPSSFCSIKLGSSVFLHLPSNSNILIFFVVKMLKSNFVWSMFSFSDPIYPESGEAALCEIVVGRVIKANAKIAETLISNTE